MAKRRTKSDPTSGALLDQPIYENGKIVGQIILEGDAAKEKSHGQ